MLLHLLKDGEFVQQVSSGGAVNVDGIHVSPAVEGWVNTIDGVEYSLVKAPPPPEPEPPTPEEIRAAMPPLQKWRFETMIDINGLREGIDQAIAGMPEPQRTIATNKRNHVPEFFRDDPLFESLGPALGMTPEQIDDMWEQALTL